ncbi:MAG: heavy-metal-associated domain-containing protein [Deltaproteobacteria bacterium]|nr:MAG: heavy-metal-associated domain-containing protein [Deltaproteobacteria bacterium]TMA41486.1 MAG: heavy-metal-associated domain-containing protein [Deltaproteobacteria bacterium]TMB36788.1 MAG: heavy-metal-associated domain-containing protein [Deltaproteobacteria bacterium]
MVRPFAPRTARRLIDRATATGAVTMGAMKPLWSALALAFAAQAAEQSLSLKVEGWHSKGDVYKTESAVQQVRGVIRVSSDLGSKTLTVVFDDASANAAVIQKAISGAGYVSHR